jgi:tRNA A-37 threonylcarbamoyl transferase component Bud32/tetratricopeptide (TPR) repeat protein
MRSCSVCTAQLWDGARRCPSCGVDLIDESPASSDSVEKLIGRRMGGKFVLRECIGTGATGHVFRADQVTLGRTVAVKVLREHLADDPEVVRRFHDEALAASRLNHPNTIAVIDYGQAEDGRLYIVMEYLRGRTLTQVMRAEFPMPVARAVALTCQILDALEEAHAAGVVHADLKSDNIVVETLRGGGDLVKVVDFGIARILDNTSGGGPDGTDPGKQSICGTPEYMAPEVIQGGELTAAADQYGAAIVLYELLTGVTPFSGGQTLEVLARQMREEPVPPAQKRPGLVLPDAVDAALARALSKRPSQRFGSVAELRAALQAAMRPQTDPGMALLTGAIAASAERECPACGAKNPARFKFCPECGERVEVTSVGTVPGTPPQRMTKEVRTMTLRWAPQPPALWPLPLVGRAQELSSLETFVAGGGSSSFLVLSAPIGLGKTRLVNEVVKHAVAAGARVIVAAPDPSGLASAWYPVRAAVAAILDLPPVCPVDALVDRLEAVGLGSRDAPGLAELFGQEGALAQLEAPIRRRECTAATLRVLRAAGASGRAAIIFEDVDRYDALSIDLLHRLAEHPIETPVRVLCTTVPEQAVGWADGVERMDLHLLAGANLLAIAELLKSAAPGGAPDGEVLTRVSRGEPARLEHAVRWFFERGDLSTAPDSLADLVAERLARLPGNVRVVLQAVAVAGMESSLDVLTQVVASEDVDDLSLAAALDLLASHGLLVQKENTVALPHVLVRDVVYDAMPDAVRRGLHRAYAEKLPLHATSAAVLGHHAELGGLIDLAVVRLLTAGDEAVRRLDDHGAAVMYQRALAAARRNLHGGDLSGDPTGRLRDLLTAAIKLADTLRLTGDFSLARGVLDEAGLLADGSHKALEAQLKRAQAHLQLAMGDANKALGPVREAIGLAMTTGSLELIAALYLDVATVHVRRGDQNEAARELQEGIDFVTMGEGVKAKTGPRSLWRLAVKLAELQQEGGKRRDALVTATHALRHAMRAHTAIGRGRANTLLAKLYEQEGDTQAVLRHRSAAVEEMRLLGDRRATAELLFESANTGQFRIQVESLEEARTLAAEIGMTDGESLRTNTL